MFMRKKEQGFTLIELLLVVVIIGILLSVIVPRAWRANIDSKYGMVRQNCSELASFGSLWAEQQIEASNEQLSTASMFNYLRTLTWNSGQGSGAGDATQQWIARATGNHTHWPSRATSFGIDGRVQGDVTDAPPENNVEDIVPVEKMPRNPFNGVSVFQQSNDPFAMGTPIPGSIACGWALDTAQAGNWAYFAFIFQGTDNTTMDAASATSYLAGQNPTLAGLRNGIFFARTPAFDAP